MSQVPSSNLEQGSCTSPTVNKRPLLTRIRLAIWGDLPREEYLKIGLLSAVLMMIVGSYWILRTQKDAIFMKITGKANIPYAKMGTFVIMFPLVFIYSKLVDIMEKHKLFYVFCGIYGLSFIICSILLKVPTMGLDNPTPHSSRILGWYIYLSIETYASITVPLFWSFTNSIFGVNEAKSGFGLIIWGAQFGAIFGPSLSRYSSFFGIENLIMVSGFAALTVPLIIWYFVRTHPHVKETRISSKTTGILEGLSLLIRYRYLMGIFGIATLFEIIVTILDYQMKYQLDVTFQNASDISKFMGSFGQWTNIMTLLFSMGGTGFFLNTYGLTACLVAFPISVGMVCVYVFINGTSVSVLFYALVSIKALSYALNVPCREMLYIPTSSDIRYKAKSWIDMFGSRAAKMIGSVINANLSTMAALALYTGPINFSLVVIWGAIALTTGRKHAKLVDDGIKLGEAQDLN